MDMVFSSTTDFAIISLSFFLLFLRSFSFGASSTKLNVHRVMSLTRSMSPTLFSIYKWWWWLLCHCRPMDNGLDMFCTSGISYFPCPSLYLLSCVDQPPLVQRIKKMQTYCVPLKTPFLFLYLFVYQYHLLSFRYYGLPFSSGFSLQEWRWRYIENFSRFWISYLFSCSLFLVPLTFRWKPKPLCILLLFQTSTKNLTATGE